MWRQILHRMGARVHPALERTVIKDKQCHGIATCADLRPGALIALIPPWACASPNVALQSPWGRLLESAVPGDIVGRKCNRQISLPQGSAITTAFLALAMSDTQNPLQAYLAAVDLEHASDDELMERLTPEQSERSCASSAA